MQQKTQPLDNPYRIIETTLTKLNAQSHFAFPMFERILNALNIYDKSDFNEAIADCFIVFYKKKNDAESREKFDKEVMELVLKILPKNRSDILIRDMQRKKQPIEDKTLLVPQIKGSGFFQSTPQAQSPKWPSSHVLLQNQILLQGIKEKVEKYTVTLRKSSVTAFLTGDIALALRYAEEPSPKWALKWEFMLYGEYYFVATFDEKLKKFKHPILNRAWYIGEDKQATVHCPSMKLQVPDPMQLLNAQWGYFNLSKLGFDLNNNPIHTPDSLMAFEKGILKFPANAPSPKRLSPMSLLEAFTKQVIGIPIDTEIQTAINNWINEPEVKGGYTDLKKALYYEFIYNTPEYAFNLAKLLLQKEGLLSKIFKKNFYKPEELIEHLAALYPMLAGKAPTIAIPSQVLREFDSQGLIHKYNQLFVEYCSIFEKMGMICVRYGSTSLLNAYAEWMAYSLEPIPWKYKINNMVSSDVDILATWPDDIEAFKKLGFIPGGYEGTWVIDRNQNPDKPIQVTFPMKKTSRAISNEAMLVQQYKGLFTTTMLQTKDGKLVADELALKHFKMGVICLQNGVMVEKDPVVILYAFKLKTLGMPDFDTELQNQIDSWCRTASIDNQQSQNLKRIIYNWIYWKKGDFGFDFAHLLVAQKNVIQKIYGKTFASAEEFISHVCSGRKNKPGMFNQGMEINPVLEKEKLDIPGMGR